MEKQKDKFLFGEQGGFLYLLVPIFLFSQLFYGSVDFSGKIIFSIVLLIYTLFIVSYFISKRKFILTGFIKLYIFSMLLLLFYLFINAFYISTVKYDAIYSFLFYFSIIAFAIFFIQLKVNIYFINVIIIFFSFIQMIAALIQIFFFHMRPIGLFFSPNYFAAYLLLSFFAALSFFIVSSNKIKIWLSIYLMIDFIFLVLSASRGAFVAFIIIFFIYLLKHKKFIFLLIILVFASILIFSFKNPLKNKFFNKKDSFSYERVKIWKTGIDISKENLLYGVGLGNYKYFALLHRYPSKHFFLKYSKVPKHAHNIFIYIFSETGLIGFILILIVILSLTPYFRFTTAFFGVIAILIDALFSDLLISPAILFPVILLFLSSLYIETPLKRSVQPKRSFYYLISFIFLVIISYLLLFANESIYTYKGIPNKTISNLTFSYNLLNIERRIYGITYNKTKENKMMEKYITVSELLLKRNPFEFNVRKDLIIFLKNFYEQKGWFKKQLDNEIKNLIELSPKNVLNYEFAGDIYKELGDKTLALKNYKTAFTIEPNFARALYKFAELEHASSLKTKAKNILIKYKDEINANKDQKYVKELFFSQGG